MDRQTLHDLGGRAMRREGSHHEEGEAKTSIFLPSTPAARRISTGNEADAARRARYAEEDLTHDDSFDDGALESRVSYPSGASWDEQSDEEGGRGSSRRDLKKSAEATTPTLIDEVDFVDDEEHEMAFVERERLRRARHFFGKDDSHLDLRRTPGAQMYRSNFDQQGMRRTPGASQMHRNAAPLTVMHQESGGGDAAALGFGLTLSTPVASSSRGKPLNLNSAWEGTESPSKAASTDQVARPPLAPGRDERGAFVAPWNLTKNPNFETLTRGACSPNTLRLTEDLDNLLLEDEDGVTDEASRHVSGPIFSTGDKRIPASSGQEAKIGKQEGFENWTAPYVVSMDGPSRVPRSSTGRNRRGKTDNIRRARGFDRQTGAGTRNPEVQMPANTGGFLPYTQQPKPVRTVQPQAFGNFAAGNQFTFGDAARGNPYGSTKGEEGTDVTPRLLNFGGAFAPPSKMFGGSVSRPIPSAPNSDPNPGHGAQPPDVNTQIAFPPNNAPYGPGPVFHNPLQQAQPFGSHPATFQPQFPSQTPMFGGNPTINQSPTFSFPPQNVGYPMQGMHHPTPNFMQNMPVHHHQRPPVPQFGPPPQVWQQPMPMQYEGISMEQGNWQLPHGGWPMGGYGYGMPPRTGNSAAPNAPTQNWKPPEPEQATTGMQTNSFEVLPQSGAYPAAPSTGQMTRNTNRGKNQRRSTSRKGATKSQSKNERGIPKLDSTTTSSTAPTITGKKSTSALTKTKKKQSKDRDRATPPNQNTNTQSASNEEATLSTADDPADAKRAELVESPAIRSALKDFYRKFRAEERSSFQDAEDFAMQALSDGSLPDSIHWRVYLELADLAKRANKFFEARNLYQEVCRLQPYASQGWLEFSKLEEECGNMNICAKILRAGLDYCQYSENLLTRAIKHEEKMGNLGRARELLARLKHVGIEKVWRTVLEGALLEARAGNDVMSRRVLKYLMHHVPWYGPLYLEAYKLERDLGRSTEALAVVERGLAAIPRYGPLWFGAFRLCEEIDLVQEAYHLPQSMAMIDRATFSISKELIWKVHLEAAQMLERASVEYLDALTDPTAQEGMDLSRKRFAMTILTCPPNLRWKVWLAAGRMEVAAGNSDTARRLFLRAHQVVPDKGRAIALLECARLEEFVGDTELSTAILCKSRSVSGSDWKVWLESVLWEIRCGNHVRAIELAQIALKLHSGTGRLWASLVQLRQFDGGEEAQFRSLKLALNAVPKSGEVWCEGARIHLNPFARSFDLPRARRHLFFATKFTPQYGDGFLETLGLEILEQWLLPIATSVWELTRDRLVLKENAVGQGQEALVKYVFEVAHAVYSACTNKLDNVDPRSERVPALSLDEATVKSIHEQLDPAVRDKLLDFSQLQLRCANADPNYGSLWFHCRAGPTDTARNILSRAKDVMLLELSIHSHIYISTFIRRFAILARLEKDTKLKNKSGESDTIAVAEDSAQREELMNKAFLNTPSLLEIFKVGNTKFNSETGMDLLESTMTGSDFASGLVALSRHQPMEDMLLPDKRKVLFGTDALFA